MRLNMNQNSLSQNQDTVIEVDRQTSQDNIERESIPQKRKSWLARILVTFIIIGVVIYGFVKNKDVFVNIYLSVFGIVLTPVLRCFCIFVEELCTTCTWTKKNVSNSFKTSFSGTVWKPIFLVVLIDGMALLKRSSFEPELDVISILSGISVGPLVIYLLKLNAQSDVELSRLLKEKGLHPAYILAWYYYTSYLEKALPVFNRLFSSGSSSMQAQGSNESFQGSDRDTQPRMKLSLKKMILLFLDNYKKEVELVDLDNHISKITDIREAGYEFPVYSLKYNRNEYKFVIRYVDEPLESIKRIRDFDRIKLVYPDPVKDQVILLYRTLVNDILIKDDYCRNKCIPILMCATQNLENGGLVELIMRYVETEECVPVSNTKDHTKSHDPRVITEQPQEPDDTLVPSLLERTRGSQHVMNIDHGEDNLRAHRRRHISNSFLRSSSKQSTLSALPSKQFNERKKTDRSRGYRSDPDERIKKMLSNGQDKQPRLKRVPRLKHSSHI